MQRGEKSREEFKSGGAVPLPTPKRTSGKICIGVLDLEKKPAHNSMRSTEELNSFGTFIASLTDRISIFQKLYLQPPQSYLKLY